MVLEYKCYSKDTDTREKILIPECLLLELLPKMLQFAPGMTRKCQNLFRNTKTPYYSLLNEWVFVHLRCHVTGIKWNKNILSRDSINYGWAEDYNFGGSHEQSDQGSHNYSNFRFVGEILSVVYMFSALLAWQLWFGKAAVVQVSNHSRLSTCDPGRFH